MASFLSKEYITASPSFNRWLVPPAALAVHLSIGMAYGFSVFWKPLGNALMGEDGKPLAACAAGATTFADKLSGTVRALTATDCNWTQFDLGWMYTLFFVLLGCSAALWGGWLERAGPRKAGLVSLLCWCGGLLISAYGVYMHQLWLMWLGSGVIGGIGDVRPGQLLHIDIVEAGEGVTQAGVACITAQPDGQLAWPALDALRPSDLAVERPAIQLLFKTGAERPELLVLLADADVATRPAQAGDGQRCGVDRRHRAALERQVEQVPVLGVGEAVVGTAHIELREGVGPVFDRAAGPIALAGDHVVAESEVVEGVELRAGGVDRAQAVAVTS